MIISSSLPSQKIPRPKNFDCGNSCRVLQLIFRRNPFIHPSTSVIISRADRKSQVRQCLGFCIAELWSPLAYESAEQKLKHCLTWDFLSALILTVLPFAVDSPFRTKEGSRVTLSTSWRIMTSSLSSSSAEGIWILGLAAAAADNLSKMAPELLRGISESEVLALKHESKIFRQSSNPVCGFSMREPVILCAVWPKENCLGSDLNQLQGWTTDRESFSRA